MDRNGDSKLQPDERALIHGRVPQFVLLSSEENGNVEGMVFLEQELRRRGLWGKVTFFMTGNYLPGRKSHPGGPVVEHWQRAFDENFGGLNGTTYAPGGQFWNLERWDEEVGVTQEELSLRLRLPKDWEWKTYPWGSRSPNLVITDVYFQALKRLRYPVLYDTSVVMHPAGAAAKPGLEEVRDLPWPFTLDSELPEGVEYPGLSKGATRASLRTRSIWELPAYAWYLRPPNGEPGWHPPIDQSLWQQYGCPGEGVRQPVIDDLLANLLAHYRGNRAPLLLGLKAQNYAKEETCKRETLLALLARIEELVGQGYNIRFSSMPDFILWQSALGAQ